MNALNGAVRAGFRQGSALGRRGMATGYAESVSELIGLTPMVKLNRVVPEESVADKVLLKLEMQNPGGSIKDRIALSMIVEAEKRGDISPGRTTIVEATSGNTGIGLAMVAAARGYKCIIAMPQVPPMYERYIIDRKFGAEALTRRTFAEFENDCMPQHDTTT